MNGVFSEFADLYYVLGQKGIDQLRADEMELRMVAATVGAHRGDESTTEVESLVAARMRHARGEGPKPEAKAPSGGQMAAMMARARGG